MIKRLVLYLVVAIIGYTPCRGEKPYFDCYWRVYSGSVPRDAVPGGIDANGNTTYIGQGLVYLNGFDQIIYAHVPLTLYPGNTVAVAAIGFPTVAAPYPKILCCSSTTSYKWVKSSVSTFVVDVVDEVPIIGGVQNHVEVNHSDTLYIGRSKVGAEVVTGKILINKKGSYAGFYYVTDTKDIKQESSFEVLVYEI